MNASVFDLIDGDLEVKQTLALGYLLAKDDEVLSKFLKLPAFSSLIGKINLVDFSKIVIHAELCSHTRKRADIVILFYKNNAPDFGLIIEAKSIRLNISPNEVKTQILNYMENEKFDLLEGFKLYGCILAKTESVIDSNRVCSVSWSSLIEILKTTTKLGQEYLKFLTNINGVMNFYEKEVYSIPAGDSYKWQYNYPYIYECPNEGRNFVSMKKPLYFTFRKEQGVMEKLFGVEEVIIMNPKQDFDLFWKSDSYSVEIKLRVKFYCDDLWGEGKYIDNEQQFFILSLSNQIELKHKPRPRKNNSFRAYYKLAELLNPDKEFVEIDR